MNKVTQDDLKGAIKGFPLHVVQAMCEEQVRQGNAFDPSVFQQNERADVIDGGFNWSGSVEGKRFWVDVIWHGQYDLIPKVAPEAAPVQKAHPHAEMMLEYAKVAQTTDKPWEHFEWREDDDLGWRDLGGHPSWLPNTEFRRKTATIRIGSYDVPKPEREPLQAGIDYYFPDVDDPEKPYCTSIWTNSDKDRFRLKSGLIHRALENAVLHAKALISLTSTEH